MPEPTDHVVEIFTDGACSPNPGPGGWGAILRCGGHEKEIYGGEPATTNNRMEIMAAIQGLESLTRASDVHVHTGSVYLRSGITRWLPPWKRNGWRTSDKKPVKNADLWTRPDSAAPGPHRAMFGSRATRGIRRTSAPTSWPAGDPREAAACAVPRACRCGLCRSGAAAFLPGPPARRGGLSPARPQVAPHGDGQGDHHYGRDDVGRALEAVDDRLPVSADRVARRASAAVQGMQPRAA